MEKIIHNIDEIRKASNFYTIEELLNIIGKHNTIIDPFSTLINKNVRIGKGNIFYPNTEISLDDSSTIIIGDTNTFLSGVRIIANNSSRIIIESENLYGTGGVAVICNINNGEIIFGNRGRYEGRINIFGKCKFEDGSQILGNINVYNCNLLGGADYTDINPENRAGLIKGVGNARNLIVAKGMVINGFGEFNQNDIETQLNYHK